MISKSEYSNVSEVSLISGLHIPLISCFNYCLVIDQIMLCFIPAKPFFPFNCNFYIINLSFAWTYRNVMTKKWLKWEIKMLSVIYCSLICQNEIYIQDTFFWCLFSRNLTHFLHLTSIENSHLLPHYEMFICHYFSIFRHLYLHVW